MRVRILNSLRPDAMHRRWKREFVSAMRVAGVSYSATDPASSTRILSNEMTVLNL